MLAILAPGQGAQKPGMLQPWLELDGAEARLRWFGAVSGIDLVRLGTTADAEEIRATEVAQPLIVALGLLVADQLELLRPDGGAPSDATVVTGHSVGELTAAAVAGALSPEAAVAFAGVRGREMATACEQTPTGMCALMGGDPDAVLARLAELELTPANRNGAGQIVAAGRQERIAELTDSPPDKTRVVPLSVAGAFHTPFMQPAQDAVAAFGDGITAHDPHRMLLSNADGTAVMTGRGVIRRLVAQLTSPVRFDLCLDALRSQQLRGIIELAPGGVLAGLAKRELKGVETVAVKSPDDLAAATDLLRGAAAPTEAEHTLDWRVVVAPIRGTIRPGEVAEGAAVQAGTPLCVVTGRREESNVSAGYDGVLAEWLVQDGDLVDSGDPIARLYPTPVAGGPQ